MEKPRQTQTWDSRFPLLTGLALFICFILFPLFLIDAGLNRVLQIRKQREIKKTDAMLESTLDNLEKFSDDRHFIHLLLDHAFTSANRQQAPEKALKQNLARLKKRYAGIFFFVVWNAEGKIIKEMTDEKSFAYILRETYRLINDLSNNCRQYYPGMPEKITDFARRLKMVRHYIGQIISTDWIQRPLQSERRACAIIADRPGKKSHFWYGVGKKLCMMAFIDSKFFNEHPGLRFVIKRLQKINPAIRVGFAQHPISPETIYQYQSETPAEEVAIAINHFENIFAGDFLDFGDRLYAYRCVTPKLRVFCHIANDILSSVSHQKKALAGSVFKWLLIGIFLLVVAIRRYQIRHIPARIKLTLLFLYAAGIPLLIIFIIGADYLQQKREELIYQEQSHGLEQLRIIDKGFVDFLDVQAKIIRQKVQDSIDDQLPLKQQKERITDLYQQLKTDYRPGSIMIFDPSGRSLNSTEENMPFPDISAISQVSIDAIDFLNRSNTENIETSQISRQIVIDFSYRSLFISSFSFGSHETYALFSHTGCPEKYALTGMLFLFWQKEALEKQYLERALRNNPALTAYFPASDRFFTCSNKPDKLISKHLHKANSMLVTRANGITSGGEEIAVAAMRGNNLSRACLGISIPTAGIDAHMNKLYTSFAFISLLFFFFCAGGILMMRRRLITPFQQFKEAITAIGERNFSFRASVSGNNEFGKLSKALNQTLENLKELEVARIVQENLLPGRQFKQNRLELMATLTQMSHIGGDYYDFFVVDEENSGIFVGDASGHGISSALIMAMARAVMILENYQKPEQNHLMQSLNDIIYNMRASGAKDYMSGLSLFINSKTGEFTLLNAGHCPPIMLRKESGKTELLKCSGLYLGFKKDLVMQPATGRLQPGDILILYTDSWLESTSKDDVPFGFARFREALETCENQDLNIFSQKMFAAISEWETCREDDMTLLLIRFGEKNDA